MDKIDEVVTKIATEFEQRPITTTLKGLAALWILKQAVKLVK